MVNSLSLPTNPAAPKSKGGTSDAVLKPLTVADLLGFLLVVLPVWLRMELLDTVVPAEIDTVAFFPFVVSLRAKDRLLEGRLCFDDSSAGRLRESLPFKEASSFL